MEDYWSPGTGGDPLGRGEPWLRVPRLIRADLASRREQASRWRTHLAGRPAAAKLAYYLSPSLVTALLTLLLRRDGSGEHLPSTGERAASQAQRGAVATVLLAEVAALPRLGAGSRTGASGAEGTYNQDADRLRGAGLH